MTSSSKFRPLLSLPLALFGLLGAIPLSAEDRPTAKETKYDTKVLWEFDGCLPDRFMKRVTTHVYNGNVYLWVLLPEYKTMIVKVPLDGGKAQMFPLMPGHVTGADPHRYYTIAADALGYIHVVGDMHTSPTVKHWVSKKPEDISEFEFTSGQGDDKRPQGHTVTYPHLFRSPDGVLYHSIRCASPVWGIGISVYEVKTQTWSMLGADVPAADISNKGRAKHAKGKPLTAWEDNGEGGDFDYTQPHAHICWDKDKRMHVSFGLLNENTPSSKGRHTGSDVLYAYSDDGGKTFCRGDGTKIKLPMRAEAGEHQADVVYSRHDGKPPWVSPNVGIHIDEKNRPFVRAHDYKSGLHTFVLEKGKWKEVGVEKLQPGDPAGKTDDDDDVPLRQEVAKLGLPYEPFHLNKDYHHETGNLLYLVLPPKDKFKRIMVVQSKPVPEKTK